MVTRMDRSTGRMSVDVANPIYIESEERVLRWLRKRYGWGSIWDARDKHRHYDFMGFLGTSEQVTIDVKADSYVAETGRVPWESRLRYMNGTESDGWGRKGIDYLAFVSPQLWRLWWCDGHRLAEVAQAALEGKLPEGFVKFNKLNPGRCAVEGLAVPLSVLLEVGAVLETVELEEA